VSSERDLEGALRGLPAPPPPPPGDALEAALGRLAPVPLRRPWRDFGKVAALSLVYGATLVGILTLRRDMHGVPMWWLVSYGIAWFVGFVGLAALALIPRFGAVMPRWRLAGLAAVLVSLGFVTMGLVMEPSSSDSVYYTLGTVHHGHTCLELGVGTAIVPVVLGALLLRGVLPVGARWTAAGLGAAGGSLGGLVLHLHCPIADRWHLGLVHGGVVAVSALLALLLAPRIIER